MRRQESLISTVSFSRDAAPHHLPSQPSALLPGAGCPHLPPARNHHMSLSLPLPQTPSLAHSPPWSSTMAQASTKGCPKAIPSALSFTAARESDSERTKAAPRHAPGESARVRPLLRPAELQTGSNFPRGRALPPRGALPHTLPSGRFSRGVI